MRIDPATPQFASAAEAARPDVPAPRLSTAQPAAAAKVGQPQAQAARLDEEQVRRAAEARKELPKAPGSRSRIRVDEASNRYIAQVVNANNEVIKQYPPEAILKFTAKFRKLQGLLFDERA